MSRDDISGSFHLGRIDPRRRTQTANLTGDFRAVGSGGWREGVGQKEKELEEEGGRQLDRDTEHSPDLNDLGHQRPQMSPESHSAQRTEGECRGCGRDRNSLIIWGLGQILLGLKPLVMHRLGGLSQGFGGNSFPKDPLWVAWGGLQMHSCYFSNCL